MIKLCEDSIFHYFFINLNAPTSKIQISLSMSPNFMTQILFIVAHFTTCIVTSLHSFLFHSFTPFPLVLLSSFFPPWSFSFLCLSVFLSVFLSIHSVIQSVSLTVNQTVCQSLSQSFSHKVSLSVDLSVCLSVSFSVCLFF